MRIWQVRAAATPLPSLGDAESPEQRLAETVCWSAPRADVTAPRDSLRYDQLRPRLLEVDRMEVVRGVAHLRASYVRRNMNRAACLDALVAGRLLAYFPDAELADGAAEQETDGYFDVNNAPPWDTWVALLQDAAQDDVSYRVILVSWVPPAFLARADRGIDVNPEGCLRWLDDVHPAMAARLLERTRTLLLAAV